MEGGQQRSANRTTILLVGQGERVAPALARALSARGFAIKKASLRLVVRAVRQIAPDVLVLVGDAAGDGGAQVSTRLAKDAAAAAMPVLLLAQDGAPRKGSEFGPRALDAMRRGVVGVVEKSASVDQMADRIADLTRRLPDRTGATSGTLGPTSVDDLVEMMSERLRGGILAISAGQGREAKSAQVVVRAGRPLAEAVSDLITRLKTLVGEGNPGSLSYEFYEIPASGLSFPDLEESRSAELLEDRRMLLIAENPALSDALAQELRAHRARVLVTDRTGSGLERGFDPDVIIVAGDSKEGWALPALRTIRRDIRLRWGSLLVLDPKELRQPGSQVVDVDRVTAAAAPLLDGDVDLAGRPAQESQFEVRLELLGPVRLLRALLRSGLGLRIRVRHPRVVVQVDLSDGLVASATARVEDRVVAEGPAALLAMLGLRSGRVRIARVEAPAAANILAPVDDAVAAAMSETAPVAPSASPPSISAEVELPSESVHAPAAPALPREFREVVDEDAEALIGRLEALLVRLNSVLPEKNGQEEPTAPTVPLSAAEDRPSPQPLGKAEDQSEDEDPEEDEDEVDVDLEEMDTTKAKAPAEPVARPHKALWSAGTPARPMPRPPPTQRSLSREPAPARSTFPGPALGARRRAAPSVPRPAALPAAGTWASPPAAPPHAQPSPASAAPLHPPIPAPIPAMRPSASPRRDRIPTAAPVAAPGGPPPAVDVAESPPPLPPPRGPAAIRFSRPSEGPPPPTVAGPAAGSAFPSPLPPAQVLPSLPAGTMAPAQPAGRRWMLLAMTGAAGAMAVAGLAAASVYLFSQTDGRALDSLFGHPQRAAVAEPEPPTGEPPAPRAAGANEGRAAEPERIVPSTAVVPKAMGVEATAHLGAAHLGAAHLPATNLPATDARPALEDGFPPERQGVPSDPPSAGHSEAPVSTPPTAVAPDAFDLAALGLAPLPQSRSGRRRRRVRELLRRGGQARFRARLEPAQRAFERALRMDPGNTRAAAGLAKVYLDQNRTAEALLLSQRLVALRQSHPANWVLLGDAHLAGGDRVAARQAFEQATTLDRRYRPARRRLAQLRRAERRSRRAQRRRTRSGSARGVGRRRVSGRRPGR